MSIFIFEDDMIQAHQLKTMVKEICEEHHIFYDFIEVTSRAEDIIEKIPRTTYPPIYFLDIEIKSEQGKGLSVAKEIRQHDPDGVIVFITTHAEFAPISYEYMVSALTFIDKALAFERRYELIKQCLLHYETRYKSLIPTDDFIVQNEHTTVRVPFATVQYITTAGAHRLSLVTSDRRINFYGSLKDIVEVDERLIRCHQSYVVNREAISLYDAKNRLLKLANEEEIPVSRRLSRTVKQVIKRGN